MVKSPLVRALIAGGLMGLSAFPVHSAGLGRLTVLSALGQPLQAEIDLVAVQPGELDTITARIASPDTFRDARIEYNPALRGVRFSVERRSSGQPYLRLSTTQPINEPFLDLLIELSWPSGRLVREFPVLLDPPGFAKPAAEPAAVRPAAPAAIAPQRPAQPAASAAGGETYGPVRSGETLGKIAAQLKPEGVSLEQMLLALYRENKSAFAGENLNRLKVGEILRVPGAGQAAAVSQAEALREIRAQTAEWNAFRQKIGADAASGEARPSGAGQEASGKIGAAVTQKEPAKAEGPTDVLKLSGGEAPAGGKTAGGTGTGALRERIQSLEEEATARENALKEANARMAELEKSVQEMRRLLEIRSGTMADAQGQAAGKPVAPGEPAKPALVAQPAAQADQPATPSAPKTEQPAVPSAPGQAAVAPQPAPEPGFVDSVLSNPLYLGAGAAALALAGLFGYRSRQRRREESLYAATSTGSLASDLQAHTVPGSKGGVIDTGDSSFLTDFDKTGTGVIDTEEVDPVAEAEVYIAYGRDTQAEEILKEAMSKDRGRTEIPLKLLEIYAARNSTAAFEAVAKELHASLGESHPDWVRVAEMGYRIDPANPLYAVAAAAAAAGKKKPEAGLDLSPRESVPGNRVSTSAAPTGVDLNLAPAVDRERPAAVDLPLDTRREADRGPTLDLDLAGSAAQPPAEKQTEIIPDDELDLSLEGFGEPEPAQPLASEPVKAAEQADLPALDFDFTPAPRPSSAAANLTAEAESEKAEAKLPPLDFSGINLDLSAPAEAESAGRDTPWQSVATKLDLAKAYLEIGDKDGAREILQEVMKEGDEAQKREAQALSATIN